MNYRGLNALVEDYAGTDLVVLGFPCNQFGLQEPGASADEIYNALKYVRPGGGFVPNFPLMQKTNVNGKDQDKIFKFLTTNCGYNADAIQDTGIEYKGVNVHDIRWNYEKFLVGRDGKPYSRYASVVFPRNLKDDINFLLKH